jgi:putative transposase
VRHIDLLREVVLDVRVNHPFTIHGRMALPDHLHRVIELPHDDDNFAIRWKVIKSNFSQRIEKKEWRSAVRERRGLRATHIQSS